MNFRVDAESNRETDIKINHDEEKWSISNYYKKIQVLQYSCLVKSKVHKNADNILRYVWKKEMVNKKKVFMDARSEGTI